MCPPSIRAGIGLISFLLLAATGCKDPRDSIPPLRRPAPAPESSAVETDALPVTTSSDGALLPGHELAVYERPVWSPDARRLAFAEWWVDYREGGSGSLSRARLLVIDRDAARPRVVWSSPTSDSWRRVSQIRWTPDGRKLWLSEMNGPFDTDVSRSTLRQVSLDGSVDWEIASPSMVEWDRSPDGNWIAFYPPQGPTQDSRAGPGLWAMRRQGRPLLQLVHIRNSEAWVEAPAWSPDGRQIAYFHGDKEPTGRLSLRMVSREGAWVSFWQDALDQEAVRRGPAWLPRAERLYAAVGGTIITGDRAVPGAARTRALPGPVAAISPEAGVCAFWSESKLFLTELERSGEYAVGRDGQFGDPAASPRLGALQEEFLPDVAIARDRSVAVTANRALHRLLPPERPKGP